MSRSRCRLAGRHGPLIAKPEHNSRSIKAFKFPVSVSVPIPITITIPLRQKSASLAPPRALGNRNGATLGQNCRTQLSQRTAPSLLSADKVRANVLHHLVGIAPWCLSADSTLALVVLQQRQQRLQPPRPYFTTSHTHKLTLSVCLYI